MGKSRSATICIAYLLHRQPGALTPQSALALVRESRPLCEPNDGFMEQLALYHEMGCPDDVTDHPLYKRWLYRRDVEESVACGRAPELKSVRFEDELPFQSQNTTGRTVEIRCRKCRLVLQMKIETFEKKKAFEFTKLITGPSWQRPHSFFHMKKKRKTPPSPQPLPSAAMFSSTP